MTGARPIEWHDVQGNVLNGYGFAHATHLMLHAGSTSAARSVLGTLLPQVTTALPWTPGAGPRTTLNVGLTHAGLGRLGLPAPLLAAFPAAFRGPTRERAADLGDVAASSPEHWVPDLGTGRVHLVLTVHARTPDELAGALAPLLDLLAGHGLDLVHRRDTTALPHAREHFGYADGFSQPDVEGVPRLTTNRPTPGRGNGVPTTGTGWRPVRLGEFLLGHPDEDGQVEVAPHPDLVRNATYGVYRDLAQDVPMFRRVLAEAARQADLPEELVAAKIVGRWRDGTALELSPCRPAPGDPTSDPAGDLADVAAVAPSNDFRYLPHDAAGLVCPRGAHIRRTNPRDALGAGSLSARHRMIRRGMPYGPVYEPGSPTADDERGLVFLAYVADIERQFETVQRDWCNDGDAFGLGDDRDYLLGATPGTGKMTVPVAGSVPRFIDTHPQLVRTRGSEYLLVPGLAALHRLAAGWPS